MGVDESDQIVESILPIVLKAIMSLTDFVLFVSHRVSHTHTHIHIHIHTDRQTDTSM